MTVKLWSMAIFLAASISALLFGLYGYLLFPLFFMMHTLSPRQEIYAIALCNGEDRALGYNRFADFGEHGARIAIEILQNNKDPNVKAVAAWVLESFAAAKNSYMFEADIASALVFSIENDPWQVKVKSLVSILKYGDPAAQEAAVTAIESQSATCDIFYAGEIINELSTVELNKNLKNRIGTAIKPRVKGKSH